jgi:hypothetical protein
MGLENLRSVFQEQLENNIDEYISNRPIDVNTTNLDYNIDSVISQTYGSTISMTTRGGRSNPILDSLLRGRVYEPIRFSENFTNDNLFIGPEQPPFDVNAYTSELETFDPRATTPKEGTLYFNTNKTFRESSFPTDFSTAGINGEPFTSLSQLGVSFYNGENNSNNLSWETLYNSDHSPKDNPSWQGFSAMNYPNVNRDNLKILDIDAGFRTANIGQIGSLLNNASVQNIDDFFTSRGVEPYIVSKIGDRETTLGGRGLPVNRMVTDAVRLGKYLTSPSGLLFITKQNALGLQGQKYQNIYNPLSTLISAGFRAGAGPASLTRRNQPEFLDILKQSEYPLFNPNAEPGQQGDVLEIVKNIAVGATAIEAVSQGSPLGVNSLLNDLQGKFQPLNFNLKDEEKPRFGPFRPQSSKLDELKDDFKQKAEKLEDKAREFLKQDAKKRKEKGESELEVAEKYPNFNPSAEGESPLEYRGEDVEDDLDFADFNRFQDNFGPFSETDSSETGFETFPNYNPTEEEASPLSRLGKNFVFEDFNRIEDGFGPFSSASNESLSTYPGYNPSAENESPLEQRITGSDSSEVYPQNQGLQSLNDSFRPSDDTSDSGFGGDRHTLLQFGLRDNEKSNELDRIQYKENIEDAHPNDSTNGTIEGSENGMPFYFKDMRDGAFIFFRAYLQGLTESVTPSYNSVNYIGRSEPVWVYERGEREINMSLKLHAHTKKELAAIYEKMNRLTSLCYPEYYKDNFTTDVDQTPVLRSYGNRMKPPLTKLRIGEMYGTRNNELLGYIKGLNYTTLDEGTWEIEAGKRVAKSLEVTINYQVIHNKAPSLETQFYGYIGDDQMADPQNISERLRSGEDV